jgi:hypothetical protein
VYKQPDGDEQVDAETEWGAEEGAEAIPQVGGTHRQGGDVLRPRGEEGQGHAAPGESDEAQAGQQAQGWHQGQVPALPPDGHTRH